MFGRGVYTITCLPTGKIYVGSAARMTFDSRWRQHQKMLHGGRHHSPLLQRAWDKYGPDAFCFEILERCEPEYCLAFEQFWMNQLLTFVPQHGFNLNPVAGSNAGRKFGPMSAERRAKLSAAQRASAAAAEGRKRMAAKRVGSKHTIETKAKQSKAALGRRLSAETREKIAAAKRGKTLSVEHKLALITSKNRAVVATCLTTGKTLEFPSLRSADAAGFRHACISQVLSGKRPHHKGYIWT